VYVTCGSLRTLQTLAYTLFIPKHAFKQSMDEPTETSPLKCASSMGQGSLQCAKGEEGVFG